MKLPARISFPKRKIVLRQLDSPLGANAKMRIRTCAKKIRDYYRIPVETDPHIQGHNDMGEAIEIDTLGKWLFGVPGYRGHIDVIPFENKIQINLYSELEEALSLILQATQRYGLPLLYVAEYGSGKIIRLGETIMKEFIGIWEDIRNALSQCGDIGQFNSGDFDIVEKAPGSWNGDKWPLGLDQLDEMKLHREGRSPLNTIAAQALYATMARGAAIRLGITDPTIAVAFGESLGSIVSGWSDRFGNIDHLVEKIVNAYCDDGYYRAAYLYVERGIPYFTDLEVQGQWKKAFDFACRFNSSF